MSSVNKPIGVFDSGVGGLTVYRALKHLLPHESFVYLGDTARVPYGTKSAETVMRYALQDSLFLLDHGVKLIVVACNTASAVSLEYLRDRLKVPVIGVIEPGVDAALRVTKNNRVGIIGTEGTIRSHVYEKELLKKNQSVFCLAKSTSLFVPIIEEGIRDDSILNPVFDFYLKDFLKSDLDTLILGCTHYPLLKDKLVSYFHNKISLVDSAEATAKAVSSLLKSDALAASQSQSVVPDRVFVTDAVQRVESIAGSFLNDLTVSISKAEI